MDCHMMVSQPEKVIVHLHLTLQISHTSIHPSGSTTLPMRGVRCTVSTLKQPVGQHFVHFPHIFNMPKLMPCLSSVLFVDAT